MRGGDTKSQLTPDKRGTSRFQNAFLADQSVPGPKTYPMRSEKNPFLTDKTAPPQKKSRAGGSVTGSNFCGGGSVIQSVLFLQKGRISYAFRKNGKRALGHRDSLGDQDKKMPFGRKKLGVSVFVTLPQAP